MNLAGFGFAAVGGKRDSNIEGTITRDALKFPHPSGLKAPFSPRARNLGPVSRTPPGHG
jgi:hypothetical protein